MKIDLLIFYITRRRNERMYKKNERERFVERENAEIVSQNETGRWKRM